VNCVSDKIERVFLCVSQSLNVGKVTQEEWISDTYINFLAVFSKIKEIYRVIY